MFQNTARGPENIGVLAVPVLQSPCVLQCVAVTVRVAVCYSHRVFCSVLQSPCVLQCGAVKICVASVRWLCVLQSMCVL